MWIRSKRLRFGYQIIHVSLRIMAKRLKTDKNEIVKRNSNDLNQMVSISGPALNKITKTNINPKMFTQLDSPTKSQSDTKEYSVIKLPNGLTALLISDKSPINNLDDASQCSDSDSSESSLCSDSDSEDISNDIDGEDDKQCLNKNAAEERLAACALCIGVGSFSDPENIPGLAHFLEHMIFMGSEKYPKENEFDIYIKKNGGSDNASTECEYTTFYFDCHESHLHGAMEIFSNLFISPLMKRESMTKEREAIESEFQMSLPSDESRKSQLLCSLASKTNPARKFMWGNLITLRDNVKDDELYEAVHKFRKRHYSAHRMTLAVQARLPVETLEKWVVECFQNIQNNELPCDKFLLKEPPFKQEEFSKLYIVEPVKNINHLDLTWVMPSTLRMYKSKPLHYLSWVLGHEGKGSLLSYLRKKLWSFGITASSGGDGTEENSIYTLFSLSLILTPEGIEHVDEVLNSVFEYIKMFQEAGPQERLFKEIQLISETSFRFSEEIASADNVESLSENMHFYPPSDYISGDELYFEYNPQLIKSFLDELKTDNVNIMISSSLLARSENLDKVEPWFGTRYKCKEIPLEWIQHWTDIKEHKHFYLPEHNPFITSNFTILPIPSNPEEYPKNIVKDDILEMWFKQDVTFKLPHAFCCIHLVSPLSRASAQNAAMLDLFVSILKQSLVEELYPANVAQLNYSLHVGEKGIVITVNGFNEKLKVLLQAVISGMMLLNSDLKLDMVLAIKDELKRSYFNANLKTSFLSRDIRMSILLETYWTALEKEKALRDVTYDTFRDFICQYLKKLHIQCLIQGNISMDDAIDFGEIIKKCLSCDPIEANTIPETQVKQLPLGEKYCVVHSFNTGDANSVVINYYQSGLGTIRESCTIELLLMIMEEPIFDSLRTKQQLGYDVSCSLRDTFGVLGFSVSVHCQSDRNSVELVERRITEFLTEFLQTLRNTTLEEFAEIKESLIKLKMCSDIHLQEEVKRNWDEIKQEEYVFDRNKKEIECIQTLTLEDIIEWFEIITGHHHSSILKKLSIQVVGDSLNNDQQSDNKLSHEDVQGARNNKQELRFLPQQETFDKFIFNIGDFKETLPMYPSHKIIS